MIHQNYNNFRRFFEITKLHSSRTSTGSISVNGDNKSMNFLSSTVIRKFLLRSTLPNSNDIKVIETRQLGHKVTGILAIESMKCKYGHPRSYVVLILYIFYILN